MSYLEELQERMRKIEKGGKDKYHKSNEEKGKLFVRKRLEILFDSGMNIEDAFLRIAWTTIYHLMGLLQELEKSTIRTFV